MNSGKDSKCEYCGNNPVPHFLNWYYESSNVLFTPLRGWLLYNPVARAVKKAAGKINLDAKLVKFFSAVQVISFNDDVSKCKVRRAQVLWEEAARRGIKMRELLLFGRPFDVYLSETSNVKGHMSNVFSGLPRPRDYDNSVLDTMDDKIILKRKLAAAGLPVPAGGTATTFRRALKIFKNISQPVIVKPRSGSRGRHTSTYIHTEGYLQRAVKIAKQLCHWVIVEEQLIGPVYRATVIDYKIRGVLRGDSPQVTGDGSHTIKELVEMKNGRPHPGVSDIVLDEPAKIFVSRQLSKLSASPLDFVPMAGQTVYLSEKIGVNYGGSSSEDFEICHPDNKKLFEDAARVVGDLIVGFDFIIPDITKSYKQQKCGFIEANSLPFINLHHDPLLGKPRNVAAAVWDLVKMS